MKPTQKKSACPSTELCEIYIQYVIPEVEYILIHCQKLKSSANSTLGQSYNKYQSTEMS